MAAKKALEGEKLEKTLQSYKEKKEKIELRVKKAQQRIENLQMKKTFKNETKTFSIGTARNAYSSPKIAYSWALDLDLLRKHLKMLSEGKEINMPIYEFNGSYRKKETQVVKPNKIIIFEGILALHDKRMRDMMDMKIFEKMSPDSIVRQ